MRQGLTPAETHIAGLVAEGLSQRGIARKLNKAVWTVKSHLGRIYQKLDLHYREGVPHVKLAVYWNCEPFQIGLRELDLLRPAQATNKLAA